MKARSIRRLVATLALGLLAVPSACTGAPPVAPGAHSGTRPMIIASFDFPESEILGQLYTQVLRAKGFPVELLPAAGSRELIEPALAEGLIDLVPEYSGSALSFLTLGAREASPDVDATHRALAETLANNGAVALAPAPAQDANAIVVTRTTADRFGLTAISDLASEAPNLVFGGPPECPDRPFCMLGLRSLYGLSFRQFVPLDTGGTLTLQALRSGEIDVAVLFTTDPAIATENLVVLTDDRRLQPAENVTPVIRQAALRRYGNALADAVDSVSARLTTSELRGLIGRVTLGGQPASRAAALWLKDQGLT
jgi:osmoprotectant transport system substrate-binding protein